MISESLHFVYDSVLSSDMKVTRVSVGSGLFEETFLANKTIRDEKVRGNDTPYHYGVERDVLTIPLSLWFDEDMTDDEVRSVARWIDQDWYKELYFITRPDRRFYAMYEGDSTRIHNGIVKGRVDLQLKTNSPYSFSPVYTSDVYDLSLNPAEGTSVLFVNSGDVNCKPILEFEKVEDGDISIVNLSDGGKEFKMTDLLNGEIITVDNHYKEITTDAIGEHRYDNHNRVYLDFPRGHNNLVISGKCRNLKFTYQFNTKA